MKEFINFEQKKDVIRQKRRQGDVATVCKMLGVTPQTFRNAMRRTDWNYTDNEMRVVCEVYNKVLERDALRREAGVITN